MSLVKITSKPGGAGGGGVNNPMTENLDTDGFNITSNDKPLLFNLGPSANQATFITAGGTFFLSMGAGKLNVSSSSAINIPEGTTVQRVGLDNSDFRYNNDSPASFEGVVNGAYHKFMMGESISKTADESILNSTTMQDDNDLFAILALGELYNFRLQIFAKEDANNPNIKIRMGSSDTLAGDIKYEILHNGGAAQVLEDLTTESSGIFLDTFAEGITVVGSIKVTTGGTFNFQWAPDNLDPVDNTTVLAQSSMTITKV